MNSTLIKSLVIAGLVLATVGTWLTARNALHTPQPPGMLKTVTEFTDGNPLPAFSLNGPKGTFTNADLAGKWSFIFFGYTQCPDVCPTALSLMKGLKNAVPPAPTWQVVFVSVDPQRDTRELLDQYMAAFDPAFIGLNGDDAALQPLLKDLGVFNRRNDEKDKKHYTVDHSAGIYLIDPQGRLAAVFSPPQELGAMTADFQRIIKQRS